MLDCWAWVLFDLVPVGLWWVAFDCCFYCVLVFMWFTLVWFVGFAVGCSVAGYSVFGLVVSVGYAGAGVFASFAVI